MSLPKLIVIAGTNASGKSGLGIELASRYGGEVVSADSRQVFTGLDLGSGKVTPEEMKGVPHHLLDVCAPGDFYSMADFQRQAYAAIDDILARGKTPFLVGGTGLYGSSVADGYELSNIAPDLSYRDYLETFDTPALYDMLKKLDPETQADPKNRNRVMRTLERIHDGDIRADRKNPRYETLRLGVTWEREALKQRIDERMEMRLEQGMIEEVKNLLDAGVSKEFMIRLGLEYRYITQYLTGEFETREAMVEELLLAIKRFAKRQMTWFKRDKEITWLDMTNDPLTQACALIDEFLKS